MKRIIITVILLVELTIVPQYFNWYLNHFNTLSNDGAAGLGFLGIILVIAVLITPIVLKDNLD